MSVCVLSEWEVRAWQADGEKPDCRKHAHASRQMAFDLTGRGDAVYLARMGINAKEPPAKWVGPRHIQVVRDVEWRVIDRNRFPRMQLVPVGTEPIKVFKYRALDLKRV